MNSSRTFIVSRPGGSRVVTIREVAPGSCAYSVSREQAWDDAQRLALPAKRSQDPKRREPGCIFFQGLNADAKLVQTAEQTQALWENLNRRIEEHTFPLEGLPIGAEAPDAPVPVAWIDEDPSHRMVIDNLNRQADSGRANDFVTSLLDQYDRNGRLSDKQVAAVMRGIEKYEAAKASGPIPEVPAGRYALNSEDDDNHVSFYVVDRPTEGKWAGYTFLKVQAGDDLHPVKGPVRNAILARIQADPKAASIRYGRELGCCGVCGRTLTDDASRAAGIGPICAEKF